MSFFTLWLSYDSLSGSIPFEFSFLSNLESMSLAVNKLTGIIPSFLGNMAFLIELYLAQKRLQGGIPAELGMLSQLNWLVLDTNTLTGLIPVALSNCTRLQTLYLFQNHLNGPIPREFGRLSELQQVLLWGNPLTGEIPSSVGNWTQLQVLDLNDNQLSGTVPLLFGKMQQLRGLMLWQSYFVSGSSGLSILTILTNCSSLEKLDLGLNYLTGVIPITNTSHSPKRSCRHSNTPALKVWPPKILYEELINATGEFSDQNLLGIGSFESVYKGILKNGTNIAVKVLKLQDEHAHQSFNKECNALKRVRHRNVIKIISPCSNLDFKALILPFMSNGSLEKWLYPPERGRCMLSMSDRVRIVMEIAQGMAYLHHYYFVQVIHCDLKPNNALLGDDMTSYIADFGISSLIFGPWNL